MSMKRAKPPVEDVLDILEYDPDSGYFFYKVSISRSKQKGDRAETVSSNGYLRIDVLSHNFMCHRLAFLFMNEQLLEKEQFVDHIDHNRQNNEWSNLRIVTRAENSRNISLTEKNRSGQLGVYWDKSCNKWRAHISVECRMLRLGNFDNIDEAIVVRKSAEKLYGYHENHGKDITK